MWLLLVDQFSRKLFDLSAIYSLTHSGCIMPLFKLYNKKNLFPSCVTKFIYKSHSIMEYNNIKKWTFIYRKKIFIDFNGFLSSMLFVCHALLLFFFIHILACSQVYKHQTYFSFYFFSTTNFIFFLFFVACCCYARRKWTAWKTVNENEKWNGTFIFNRTLQKQFWDTYKRYAVTGKLCKFLVHTCACSSTRCK